MANYTLLINCKVSRFFFCHYKTLNKMKQMNTKQQSIFNIHFYIPKYTNCLVENRARILGWCNYIRNVRDELFSVRVKTHSQWAARGSCLKEPFCLILSHFISQFYSAGATKGGWKIRAFHAEKATRHVLSRSLFSTVFGILWHVLQTQLSSFASAATLKIEMKTERRQKVRNSYACLCNQQPFESSKNL
jgi:hypothetical protein